MDAFFVSVELTRDPTLRGRPVVVGGAGPRGVVAAASYEARSYGVHSAMPSSRARRLCPDAVFVPADHRAYAEVSSRVMAIFSSVTPLVEPLSLDEAFLDVTGALTLIGDGRRIAAHIRSEVLGREGLTCSVGVATNKLLAKLASEAAKPQASPDGPVLGSGVHVVEPGAELDFLHPLPVRALWGVGPKTFDRLRRLGVQTVGDLAALPAASVRALLGRVAGDQLLALAQGVDDRPVQPNRDLKSVGHEETFTHDRYGRDDCERELLRMADAVAGRLRHANRAGRTVVLKVRFGDFRTVTRSATLVEPLDTAPVLYRTAVELLATLDPAPGVRLLGLTVTGLVPAGIRQLSLVEPPSTAAATAIDAIRRRHPSQSRGAPRT
jgi:DNA polymerase IV